LIHVVSIYNRSMRIVVGRVTRLSISMREACVRLTAMLIWLAVASAPVHAHAIVVDATPSVNSTVVQGPLVIQLQFNSRLDLQRSRLTLQRPDGSEQPVTVEPLAPAGSMRGRAEAMPPGAWKLRWQVLSLDGHITCGEIPFSVRAVGNAP
jgi:copper resistance protein C